MPDGLLSLLLLTGLFGAKDPSPPAASRLVVIVSLQNATSDLSLADLRRVYVGAITRWPDGPRILPVVPDPDSAQGELFLKRVVQMTDIDYAQLWIGQVFRGRASGPPHVVRSGAGARQYVLAHPAAIAVVTPDAVDASVKVLTIDGKPFASESYALAW